MCVSDIVCWIVFGVVDMVGGMFVVEEFVICWQYLFFNVFVVECFVDCEWIVFGEVLVVVEGDVFVRFRRRWFGGK